MSAISATVSRLLGATLACHLVACSPSQSTDVANPPSSPGEAETPSGPSDQTTPPSQPGETEMQNTPVEADEILLFEKISLGTEAEANRRWKVSGDGTVWFSKNKPPVARGEDFNQPFERLGSLSAEQRQAVLDTARSAGFWEAPERVGNEAVEDGMRLRLTVRDGDKVRTIIADNEKSPAIEAVTAKLFEALGH
jgi:hypothetical protein